MKKIGLIDVINAVGVDALEKMSFEDRDKLDDACYELRGKIEIVSKYKDIKETERLRKEQK